MNQQVLPLQDFCLDLVCIDFFNAIEDCLKRTRIEN